MVPWPEPPCPALSCASFKPEFSWPSPPPRLRRSRSTPFAGGTDSTGQAQAVSDAVGRVLIESPEFPRGLWVDLVDEGGRGLAGIQVVYQDEPDSLVAMWSVDPSGLQQETLLWTRQRGPFLSLMLKSSESAELPAGLTSIDWRIDPEAKELLVLQEGPELIGPEAATALLQERWQGRTGRVAVQIDSTTALAVDLDQPAPAERLVEYLGNRGRSSLGEEIAFLVAFLVEVLLTTHTFDRDLALLEDSIVHPFFRPGPRFRVGRVGLGGIGPAGGSCYPGGSHRLGSVVAFR